MKNLWGICGSLFGFVGVAMGAFAAHGLRGRLSEQALGWFETGVRYQMYHALALFAVAWVSATVGGTMPKVAGALFVAGILIFSGSLYALAFTGMRGLGAITPIGGLCFLAGWIVLAWSFR